MAWTGKVVGGVLGSLIGPLGAVIGVGIGHQFDKGASRVQKAKMAMQAAFFGCLAKMAKADGVISREEINAVEQIITRLGYSAERRAAAIDIFRAAKDDPHSAADYLKQLADVIKFNPPLALTFMSALHAVAQSDGTIHPNEHEILLQAEQIFRLPKGTVDALMGGGTMPGRQNNELAAAYKTLECTPEMSDMEIKKIYREKCIEYHPDKLASKGLPEEFMNFANDQLSKVNSAYDIIKKSRD